MKDGKQGLLLPLLLLSHNDNMEVSLWHELVESECSGFIYPKPWPTGIGTAHRHCVFVALAATAIL
ncbi:MAG: hypothetical protein DRP61_05655 [Candidatus Omnitrophota bacterium]|nr:MAG: hypothetical protein DRP61_05655 [Candidatus Omnitrophota bacterium]